MQIELSYRSLNNSLSSIITTFNLINKSQFLYSSLAGLAFKINLLKISYKYIP